MLGVARPPPAAEEAVAVDTWPTTPLRWPSAPLTDGVAQLDRVTTDDVDALVDAVDAEIARWLPLPLPYQQSDALTFLSWLEEQAQAGTHLGFAIRRAGDRRLRGSCGLSFRGGPGVAEVGYWVGRHDRDAGLARRATRLLAAFAVERFSPRRIELLVQPDNLASCAAARGAGATYEGVRRAGIDQRGEHLDAAVFSLLPSDLSELAAGPRPGR